MAIFGRSPDETVLEVTELDPSPLRARLQVAGDHNASNALVVLATAAGVVDPDGDVTPDRLLWALSTFPGIGRRL